MYQAEFNGKSLSGGRVYGRRPAFQYDVSTQKQPSYFLGNLNILKKSQGRKTMLMFTKGLYSNY